MITKTSVRPYKGTDQWEADVFMLINGKEVRRRWRSPMPSKLATERWAREKAKGFLADYGKPARPAEEEEEEEPTAAMPLFKDYAVRWMNEYVIANRHSTATIEGREKCLRNHLLPLLPAWLVVAFYTECAVRFGSAKGRSRIFQAVDDRFEVTFCAIQDGAR